MYGWTWSSNIGWGSASSTQPGAGGGGTYGLQVDGSGNINGYIWTSNIGWIKFGNGGRDAYGPLSSFPGNGAPPANANVSSTGVVTGWARACAGTLSGNCSSMASRTDGWDGWIELSGANHVSGSGGVTLGVDPANTNTYDKFSGYAWGSDVVGWVNFSDITLCPGGICGTPPQPTNTLTVTPSGTGSGAVTGIEGSNPDSIICGYNGVTKTRSGNCTENVATAGTLVTLTATPAPGSSFTSWSVPTCTDTGPGVSTCPVNVSGAVDVTANFTVCPGGVCPTPSPRPIPPTVSCTGHTDGTTIFLTATSTGFGGDTLSYSWTAGSGFANFVGSSPSYNSTPSSAGNYSPQVSVTDINHSGNNRTNISCGGPYTINGSGGGVTKPELWPGSPSSVSNYSNYFRTSGPNSAPLTTHAYPGDSVKVSYAYPGTLTGGCIGTITPSGGATAQPTTNPTDWSALLSGNISSSIQLQSLSQGVYTLQYSCKPPPVQGVQQPSVSSNPVEIDVSPSTIREQ
jgi:hypothetical protein